MSDTIINHDEAFQLAQIKQQESNLARCYLDLRAQLAAPGAPVPAKADFYCFPAGTYAIAKPAPGERQPVAWMVYFVRPGMASEDKLVVYQRDHAEKEVMASLIRRVMPLYE